MFDAFLLQQGDTSMLTARDAYLAADRMRFGGANQTQLWTAFAKRGMGESASTKTTEDDQPKAGFDSPLASNASIRFTATDSGTGAAIPATVYIGRYEARVTPVADTVPSTALGSTVKLVPGTYSVYLRSPGHGLRRFTLNAGAGQSRTQNYALTPNYASKSQGATIAGAGTNQQDLIDDTESTTWDVTAATPVNAARPNATIALGGRRTIRSVAVSALLDPDDPDADESRFTALRAFRVSPARRAARCPPPGRSSTRARTTRSRPSDPRPLAPDLTLRFFDVPDTAATHLRFTVLGNQCTSAPMFQGEQDDDPLNATDCDTASDSGNSVHPAEFQAFGQNLAG